MKNLVVLLFLTLLFTACKSTSPVVSSKKEKVSHSENRKTERIAEQLIDVATKNVGIKYKYGGTTKTGFDCSGLMYAVFNSENITIPRSSLEQSKLGTVINQKKEKVRKGDLIFFKTDNSKKINHVGIIIEVNDDDIIFIHSSTSKGVIISSTKQSYYKNTFAQINRIL
ncbi:NlpC/P60 family protein [Flavobacterium micromati]|uniref:NlpC/P60 family protein n=1 Tax=Flavobacterium micromati TaxID=229205 RepID=A0A1M5NMV0_9FLAO|nr:C40 family peptidase [Flavobacterium micromati]MCL6462558.1 C40 family peptidase [Flavobacterium micromati]SHG90818.1 NlpC/P60 family protein [Flavobacterium micromati]